MANFPTMLDMIGLKSTSENSFISLVDPERMGNTRPIAYGGCTIGIAASAAYQNIPEGYRIYSLLGNFLGPALTDRKYICRTREVRRTKTFITKLIEVGQRLDDGQERMCLIATADFQVREPTSLLTYSKPPVGKYDGPEQQLNVVDIRTNMVKDGRINEQQAATHEATFGAMRRLFDNRPCKEGISGHTLNGFVKNAKTPQDGLGLTSKTSADWIRCLEKLATPVEHAATLGWLMDAAVSFIPVVHSGQSIVDVGACSTLDFALRFFTADFDINDFHLREWKTVTGGEGRTYTESRIWNQEGKTIASMTQTCILRPTVAPKPKI